MHIAEIAPLAESVPPSHYGGAERVVSWLTDELVGLVTLFASAARTQGPNLFRYRPSRCGRAARRSIQCRRLPPCAKGVARRAKEFLHGRLDLPHMHSFAASFADAPLSRSRTINARPWGSSNAVRLSPRRGDRIQRKLVWSARVIRRHNTAPTVSACLRKSRTRPRHAAVGASAISSSHV
jgi:hypothetical protein